MSSLTTYNGLNIVTPDPAGLGGLAINNNFKAVSTPMKTANPGSGDDSNHGYVVGSRWYNTTTATEWICTSAAAGAANWQELSAVDNAGNVTGNALRLTVPSLASAAVLTIKNPSGPSWYDGNAFEVQNSSGVATTYIRKDGAFICNSTFLANSIAIADAVIANPNAAMQFRYNGANVRTAFIAQNDYTTAQPLGALGVYNSTGTAWKNTSGFSCMLGITSIYDQTSGSAANTDLLINRTETAVGSGQQLLIDAQVGGTSKFSVTNTGKVNATSINIGPSSTPANSSAAGNAGDLAWDSSYLYIWTATNTVKRVALATF